MRRFSYGINSHYKTAHINIDIAPFYIFWLDSIVGFICSYFPRIPLPKIPFLFLDKSNIEFNDGKKWSNLKDWYGNLSAILGFHIYNPISDFCWKRQEHRFMKIDYDEVQKCFENLDKKFWDSQEDIGIEEDENLV